MTREISIRKASTKTISSEQVLRQRVDDDRKGDGRMIDYFNPEAVSCGGMGSSIKPCNGDLMAGNAMAWITTSGA